jgi:acyl dehydratase
MPRQPSINPSIVGLSFGPVEHAWQERDVILYALSIGARYPADLEFLYEGAGGLRVTPTFGITAITRVLPPMVEALALDPRHLLHAGQEFEITRVPPATGRCWVTRTITGLWDKGAAAIVDCEDLVADDEGTLAVAHSNWWVAGAGGFGGASASPGRARPPTPPAGPPDRSVICQTSSEQAALYRLNGDLNPVHIDPTVATEAGQREPFLHGLCTFGILAFELERCAGPGRRLVSLLGRFTNPVFPGESLRLDLWDTVPDDTGPADTRPDDTGHDDTAPDQRLALVRAGNRTVLGPVAAAYRAL